MYNLKEMVKDKKRARFCFYRDDALYYETECGFKFKVPLSDTGTGTFLAEESALQMMRWIRPAIQEIEEARGKFIADEIDKEVLAEVLAEVRGIEE